MPPAALPQGYTLIALDEAGSTNDEAKARAAGPARRRAPSSGPGVSGPVAVGAGASGTRRPAISTAPCCCAPPAKPGGWRSSRSFAALAVLDLVDGLLPGRARCKWPNDILVDGGKVAGILLESALRSDGRVDWVVLGIGVNPRGTSRPRRADPVDEPRHRRRSGAHAGGRAAAAACGADPAAALRGRAKALRRYGAPGSPAPMVSAAPVTVAGRPRDPGRHVRGAG